MKRGYARLRWSASFAKVKCLPGETEGEIMYCGHLDVAPAGHEGRTSPPYEPEIRGGALYGRGANHLLGLCKEEHPVTGRISRCILEATGK